MKMLIHQRLDIKERTMTREEATKHLSEWMDEKMWRCFGTIDREAIGMAIEALSTKTEWIPCSERLPDIGNRCLVTLSNNVVAIGTLHNEDNKRWHLEPTSMMIAYYEDSVTAWIPLPMPYRKDGE